MPAVAAGALVFFTSAAVLVLEILAARLLAPYVGVTLETYTAIIGTVLAGIAAGTWVGGWAADRVDPRRMLGPLLVAGGLLAVASVPIVRALGPAGAAGGGSAAATVVLAGVALFAPAAVLSAVTPTVVKLQLRDLAVTGLTVGRLSAIGTVGAIAGTFVAGFVLVELVPTSASIILLGGAVTVAGAATWLALARMRFVNALVVAVLLAGAAFVGAVASDVCDVDTTYHCARVVTDDRTEAGRLLVLDTLHHSYVDLDDPAHLEFRYTNVFADVIDALAPAGALDALHVGGGGFTMPRYLRATRAGSRSVVLEVDGRLVELVEDRLGLVPGDDIDVRVGDARLLVDDVGAATQDVVLGDAFGGLAVPWHLTTQEFVADVERVLRDDGFYVLNVIDYPPLRFARAETATLQRVFPHVAVVGLPGSDRHAVGGNVVLVASNRPVDAAAITHEIRARGGDEVVLTGAAVDDFVDGAPVLTDDHAPVDQWLARSRRS